MSRRAQFDTIRSEGALLPTELLQRVSERDKELGGLRGEDYGLPPNEPLNEAIVRSYNRLVGAWASFQEARAGVPDSEPGTSITRDRWLQVLMQELGYGRVQIAAAVEIGGKTYPVSHAWGSSPIHLVGCNIKLDRRARGVAGAAMQSPHGTVQELLNRSDERLWGIVSNGLQLRLLRDNSSLTRQAYVEFDLEEMMEGEVYADFVLLWMVCHASRVEGDKPHECWLERWSQEAAKQGTRALEGLRDGVETAIAELGSGFLTPGRNAELKAALRSGDLSPQEYYRELLRLVYRLLFLFVAEDRDLLQHPQATREAKERYDRWYSTRRLRDLAEKRRGTKHRDLWESLAFVMRALSDDSGCDSLGLPALGSFLWSERALPHLERAQLPNRALLEAVRALATVREGKVLRAVDYKNLGAEELGSVYESLLELHPRLDADAGTFRLDTAAGNERKMTGSYYTPTSLITVLLDSALDPVLDEAAADGEEAILDLKVVDPACGSGHFLVAAAHRIAKRLATARTGDEEPSPEATRHALRDVVSRCIYGVDLNPMAVELCKVSLWMEALDPGLPLGFLDAHIKCGNSLLGTTSELMAGGVPDVAFKTLEGDDKEIAKALRKQNKQEREGQLSFEDAVIDLAGALEADVTAAEALGDESVESLHAKERRFHELSESEAYERAKLAADAWCAAFTQRKEPGAPRITSGVVRRLASGRGDVADSTRHEVQRFAHEYGLFHWELEYPQVFARPGGGFDCVLGNPPWERVKLQEKEFFAGHLEIAGARNASQRKRLIAQLEEEDAPLFASWQAALRKAEGESLLLRTSGRYPLCGRGDVNTYALFAELDYELLGRMGLAGAIFPTGIVTDLTTSRFFSHLVSTRSLVSVFDFRNHDGLFYDVGHRTFKFCLLTTSGTERKVQDPEFVFWAEDGSDVVDPQRRYALRAEDFWLVNPNSGSCPAFRSRREADLVMRIYRKLGVLRPRDDPSGGPWNASFLRMFDMANDSGLFYAENDGDRLPLYEGKMAHQFDHRWATYADGEARSLTSAELADPTFSTTPQWWIDRREVLKRLPSEDSNAWLIGWRDIARPANVRTVIASALPLVAVGHNMPLIAVAQGPAAMLLANLNSFVLDFVAKRKIGGTHVTFFVVEQLPILPPTTYDESAAWDQALTLVEWFSPRVLELVYTASDMAPFARAHGNHGPPFQWNAERRALLRAELDAAFFHLYDLKREDVDYVMDTFWVVRERDVKAHGEYRTKRLILEIYDELAQAIQRGEPYQTRLDPPPADPRIAHPARALPATVEATP